ncbi:BA75_03381T0 [Komagataella pastoris]|uniref:peptide chain release factor N(5)-glutamine methyltransferase n=1 Tax=Komagataella pastoris TaxID=4922 RepID=A0A1B2JG81_PICPA|nr:BA75_03381T0 [Komagataella pastoris]
MPKLLQKPRVIARYQRDLLTKLLPACTTLQQAQRELSWIQKELPREQWEQACTQRGCNLMPLQYILGNQPFGSVNIKCRPGVLIPRNDTEEWCGELVDLFHGSDTFSVLDMCTGSGCIALYVATELSNVTVLGGDISQDCISLANENIDLNKDIIKGKISVDSMDLFQPLAGEKKFDVVVSNPPYIPTRELDKQEEVEESVRLYEPRLALEGDLPVFKALVTYHIIPSQCKIFMLEIGSREQGQYTRSLLNELWVVGLRLDSAFRPRNVIGFRTDIKSSIKRKVMSKITELL